MKEWTSECWTPSDRSDTRVKDTEMKCSKQLSVELISDSVCVCFSSGSQRSCSRKLWRVSLKTTIHPILFCSCHQTTHRLSINPPVCPASEITVKAFLQQCVCVALRYSELQCVYSITAAELRSVLLKLISVFYGKLF